MADALVSDINLLGKPIDIVAVFDSSFNQVFSDASPMRDEVLPRSRIFTHPIETGQLNSDYKIVLPIQIRITLIVQNPFYRNVYQEIMNLFKNSELLTVQTKTASYDNMIIAELPSEERPEMYDAILINILFQEAQIVSSQTDFAPENVTDSDTVKSGVKSPDTKTFTPVATQTASRSFTSGALTVTPQQAYTAASSGAVTVTP